VSAAVQTSAPAADADMFGHVPPAPITVQATDDVVIEIQGRLVHHAELRNKLVEGGTHTRPVLCLDLTPIGANCLRRRLHVELPFPESRRKDAEARVALLKRGTHVSFRTTLIDMLTVFPHVLSVDILPSH
jgi:hypothetical protein